MAFKEQVVALRRSEPELTYREIAARIGCTESTVIRSCMNTGLLRPRPETFKARIIALRKSEPDLKYREIAAILGCAESTVSDVCCRAVLKSGKQSQLQSAVLRLGHAAYRLGLTVQQIQEMANARHA
jgi:DNA-directed RNA polymerase specialized sigma24 family protein